MANNIFQYGKSIQLTSNLPLDTRQTIASLNNLTSIIYPYVGMIFYSIADSKHYKVITLQPGYMYYSDGEYHREIEDGMDEWVDYEPVDDYFIGTYEELVSESSGGGTSTASDVSYSIESNTSISNVKQALDDIYDTINYVAPSINTFTMSPSITSYELGTVINNITFNWSYNKEIVSQSLTGCTININDRTANYTTPLSSSKSFTLSAKDSKDKSVSKGITINFYNKKYWGASSVPSTIDSDFIKSLSNNSLTGTRSGNISVNAGSGEYIWFAIPVSFGVPTCKIGGFDTELLTVDTISFTNNSGYTTDYNIYRTTQANLGNVTLVIS